MEDATGDLGHERQTVNENLLFREDIQDRIIEISDGAFEGNATFANKWEKSNRRIAHYLKQETAKARKKDAPEVKRLLLQLKLIKSALRRADGPTPPYPSHSCDPETVPYLRRGMGLMLLPGGQPGGGARDVLVGGGSSRRAPGTLSCELCMVLEMWSGPWSCPWWSVCDAGGRVGRVSALGSHSLCVHGVCGVGLWASQSAAGASCQSLLWGGFG